MGEGGLGRCGSLGREEGAGAAPCLGRKVGRSPGGAGLAARIRRGSEGADPLSQPEPDFLSEPGFLTASWGNPACPVTEGCWLAAAFSDSGSLFGRHLAGFFFCFFGPAHAWPLPVYLVICSRLHSTHHPCKLRLAGRPWHTPPTLACAPPHFTSHSPRVGLHQRGCPISSASSVQPSSTL